MKSIPRVLHQWSIAISCLLLPCGLFAINSQQDLESELIRSAQNWSAKNRPDIARQLIVKLLAAYPDSADGLAYSAELNLRDNKPAEASKTLAILHTRFPQHKATRDLETLIRVYGADREKLGRFRLMALTRRKVDGWELDRARNAASASAENLVNTQKAEAAQFARELFPNGPPSSGDLQLEYYQIISNSPRDSHEAAEPLARIYRETRDSRYQLALLEMRFRESKDLSPVLRELETLSRQTGVNQSSLQDLWRRVINRLDNIPANTIWANAFLKRYPNDSAMMELITAMQRGVVSAKRTIRNPISQVRPTEKTVPQKIQPDLTPDELEAELAMHPNDVESVGRLGQIRLDQTRYLDAQALFSHANELTPNKKWQDLQSTANLRFLLQKASQDLAHNDISGAFTSALQATELQPNDVDALLALADITVRLNNTKSGLELYQRVLAIEPDNSIALRSEANLYAKLGQDEHALAILTQAVAKTPALKEKLAYVRVTILRSQSDKLIEAGELNAARQPLEAAVLIDPENPWLRHSLARLYLRLDMPTDARRTMDEGIRLDPTDSEARYARALIRSALDDDAGALEDIKKIHPTDRTEGVLSLEQRTLVRQQVVAAEQPDKRELAEANLALAEKLAANDPNLLLSISYTWFRLDQPTQALSVFERLLRRQPKPASNVELQYAILLNRAQEDAKLEQRLPVLLNLTDWTPQQEIQLLDLYTDHQIRRIEQKKLAGDVNLARSMARVAPPINIASDSTLRQKAQLRMLIAAGAYAEVASLIGPPSGYLSADIDFHLTLGRELATQGLFAAAMEQARWLDKQISENDLPRRIALLRLWQISRSISDARHESSYLLSRFPNNVEVIQLAARLERDDGQYAQAALLFRRAGVQLQSETIEATATTTAETSSKHPEQALQFSSALSTQVTAVAARNRPSSPKDAPLILAMTTTSIPAGTATALAANQIQREIDNIEAGRQAWVEVGERQLQRSSTSGISTLNGWERPVVATLPSGLTGRYFVHVDPVNLVAGQLPPSTTDTGGFGQVAPTPVTAFPADSTIQSSRGLNLGIGYQGSGLNWDVGAIGVGFPVTNVVGGVSQRMDADGFSMSLELSRRPLTGSLLSYAGAIDPVTHQVWGGVVATGLTGRVATDIGSYSVSASASYARLTGRNVEENTRTQWRFAMERDILTRPGRVVNVGLALSAWHHEKDLSEFTWGNGGYYSPQRYLSLSLPVEWSGRDGAMTWQLRGAVSASRSSSDDSAYFPTNSLLQAQALANLTSGQTPFYTGSGSSGSGFSLRGAFEYQVTQQTALGAQLEVDRSAYYSPNNLMLYARYQFGPGTAPLANRPRPVQAYSSF